MQYAIFSDVHSNYEALKTFILHMDFLEEVKLVCLGDLVGYGACPNECIKLIRDKDIPVVMGNHDFAIINPIERPNFNEFARMAIEWQNDILEFSHRDFLKHLPWTLVIDNLFSISHGDFTSPHNFIYIYSKTSALASMEVMQTFLGFIGHTHVPMFYADDPDKSPFTRITSGQIRGDNHKIHLKERKRYLINPGSLGQPRDGDSRASYVIYDPDEHSVTFHRIFYNIKKEQQRFREASLPSALAERILVGH